MRVLFSVTARDGERFEYGEVELQERGKWFLVNRDGQQISMHHRCELLAWSICAPRS